MTEELEIADLRFTNCRIYELTKFNIRADLSFEQFVNSAILKSEICNLKSSIRHVRRTALPLCFQLP
jgi:hypothetical protein